MSTKTEENKKILLNNLNKKKNEAVNILEKTKKLCIKRHNEIENATLKWEECVKQLEEIKKNLTDINKSIEELNNYKEGINFKNIFFIFLFIIFVFVIIFISIQ